MLKIENIFLTSLKFGLVSEEFIVIANDLPEAHETLSDFFEAGTFDIEYLMPLSRMIEIAEQIQSDEYIVSSFLVKDTEQGFIVESEETIKKGSIEKLQQQYPTSVIIPAEVVWAQTQKMLAEIENLEHSEITPLLSKNFELK